MSTNNSRDKKRNRLADSGPLDEENEYPQKSRRRDLTNLLDFSALTSPSDINIRFGQLADCLISGHYLLLKHGDLEHEFDIIELEFYLQKSGCHEDPFTHAADEQNRYCGQW